MAKRSWLAYALWPLGLHHFYLGRDRHGFAFWCTLGGFGFGYLRDLWRIPSYVADANADEYRFKKLVELAGTQTKPPLSVARFGGEVLLGYIFGLVYFCAIPNEDAYSSYIRLLTFLTPLAISIGVHTVGNIGLQQGRLKATVISTFISWYFSYDNMPKGMFWCAFSSTCAFTFKSREWRLTPPKKHGLCRRVTILGTCGLVYFLLLASGLYFNAEVVDKYGENIKFRDAAINFLNSPMWEELKDSMQQLYNFYQAHGWQRLYENVIDQLDPHGERRAYKVLGLPTSATKPEIQARWRQLSREWHPDRHKEASKKEEAHIRFIEYQDAYQKLIKIRAKTNNDDDPGPPTQADDSRSDL